MGAYGFYELEYVRTDRNGTKIYHDNNCPLVPGTAPLKNGRVRARLVLNAAGPASSPSENR